MKSIEECLDIILRKLVENWDLPQEQRTSLKGEELLSEFGLSDNLKKHEFFKRLIRRLIKDDYAEPVGKEELNPGDDLSKYENATLITIEGLYFITKEGGYEKQKTEKLRVKTIEDSRNQKMERNDERLVSWTKWLTYGTIAAAAAALGLLLWDFIKYFLEHHSSCN